MMKWPARRVGVGKTITKFNGFMVAFQGQQLGDLDSESISGGNRDNSEREPIV
jgi:hypothetical protein